MGSPERTAEIDVSEPTPDISGRILQGLIRAGITRVHGNAASAIGTITETHPQPPARFSVSSGVLALATESGRPEYGRLSLLRGRNPLGGEPSQDLRVAVEIGYAMPPEQGLAAGGIEEQTVSGATRVIMWGETMTTDQPQAHYAEDGALSANRKVAEIVLSKLDTMDHYIALLAQAAAVGELNPGQSPQ
jgi:hypothetical protein